MTVIFKLGGSLFTLSELANRAREVVSCRSGENCLMIPGGGFSADLVRDWSRLHNLDDETCHWIAVASMDFNNCLLQRLTNWNVISSREQAESLWSMTKAPLLLQSEPFLSREESQIKTAQYTEASIQRHQTLPNLRDQTTALRNTNCINVSCLPHDWTITSDSIAAWTSIRWPADELILLKSIPAPLGLSAQQASDQQFVDPWFPRLATQIPRVSWCNLRNLPIVIETWLTSETL